LPNPAFARYALPFRQACIVKDMKRARKKGKNLEKFKIIARTLIEGRKLDPLHRDHRLFGSTAGRRECHIEVDWLFVHKCEDDKQE
jgi:mRNA interferase YafQ